MRRFKFILPLLAALVLMPSLCLAGEHFHLPHDLSILWVIPFVCMLLSIALGPLTVPHFWEHHFGKIAVFWGLAFLVPCGMATEVDCAAEMLKRTVHLLGCAARRLMS